MNKKEFLSELENALNGKLTEPDIWEITSDYGDIFDNGTANGKSEEEVAGEIGSPAKIARTILEDGPGCGGAAGEKGPDPSGAAGKREYSDFQKNINEKTSRIIDKVTEPDRNVRIEALAPMARRLWAYIIDSLLGGSLLLIFLLPLDSIGFSVTGIVPLLLLFGAFNLFTMIILWATNGYTPGKWLLKMKVVKISGSRIGFLDAFLRELVIKCIVNSLVSGFLNIGSFIWGYVTDDHKTVHDLVAQTRVIDWGRRS